MSKKRYKIAFFILTLGIVALLFFFFRNIILDVIKYAKDKNTEAISGVLKEYGIFGTIAIIVIEALQMVVVFIPAEFIQIASGISYNPLIAFILCDLGVFLGATIIYVLVNVFRMDQSFMSKHNKKINKMSKKTSKKGGIQALMYILFVMPVVPFGAICYFGSSMKLSYRRYILTCVTGVIPSILSSILLGNLFIYFTASGLPLWILIVAIILVIGILFLAASLIMKKLHFKKQEGNPDSLLYMFFLGFLDIIVGRKCRIKYDRSRLKNIDGPIVVLGNHGSYFDFYYAAKLLLPNRVALVANRFYYRIFGLGWLMRKVGAIPKKLFSPDIETIKKSIRAVKDDYSLLLFPEGRLSTNGMNYHIVDGTGALLKKLNVPVVIISIDGAHLANPKWRKKRFNNKIKVSVKEIISVEELALKSVKEIDELIDINLAHNDFEYAREKNLIYKQKNKALGMENVLYRCPKCNNEYTIETSNNSVKCNCCNFEVHINNNYSFDKNELDIKDMSDWYNRIVDIENKVIHNDDFMMQTEVTVKRKNLFVKSKDKDGKGICTLTNDTFSFKGIVNKEDVEFSIPIRNLKALAFTAGKEFECYYDDDLYYFYPNENKAQCAKWALIVDELFKAEHTNE